MRWTGRDEPVPPVGPCVSDIPIAGCGRPERERRAAGCPNVIRRSRPRAQCRRDTEGSGQDIDQSSVDESCDPGSGASRRAPGRSPRESDRPDPDGTNRAGRPRPRQSPVRSPCRRTSGGAVALSSHSRKGMAKRMRPRSCNIATSQSEMSDTSRGDSALAEATTPALRVRESLAVVEPPHEHVCVQQRRHRRRLSQSSSGTHGAHDVADHGNRALQLHLGIPGPGSCRRRQLGDRSTPASG